MPICQKEIFNHTLYLKAFVGKEMTDVKIVLNSNSWNHLTMCKQISSGSFMS